ncbi:MAG TPA: class I SAM-dependent methyltransferase [Planctomycetota bacterium]|nr:class I SAM-dependent methyltransferase [Planctomycetota bacterium]
MLQRTPEPELMDLPHEADAYARADFSDVNQRFVDRLLEVCSTQNALRVVDLGTGPADIPIRIARARPAWTITAVDAAQAMLDIAAREIASAGLDKQITLVLADAKKTVLPAASFDLVCSNSILHHVADAQAFWREAKRLLKPGGVVFLRDLFRPASEEQARAIVRQHAGKESALLQEEFFRSLLAAYTPGEIREQLSAAGLDGLTVQTISDRHVDVFGRV